MLGIDFWGEKGGLGNAFGQLNSRRAFRQAAIKLSQSVFD
jgi:hypothetical protein